MRFQWRQLCVVNGLCTGLGVFALAFVLPNDGMYSSSSGGRVVAADGHHCMFLACLALQRSTQMQNAARLNSRFGHLGPAELGKLIANLKTTRADAWAKQRLAAVCAMYGPACQLHPVVAAPTLLQLRVMGGNCMHASRDPCC